MATQKRKKLTLDQVETQMEVLTKEEMDILKGGGDGSFLNPYTVDEYNMLTWYGIFKGGYVRGMGYVNALSPVVVSPNNNVGLGSGYSGIPHPDSYNGGGGGGQSYGPHPYMSGGGGKGASSHYTPNTNDNNSSSFSHFVNTISDLWNSATARMLVPDVFSLNLSTSATAIIGVNYEFSINFITRGNDASLIPVISIAPGVQGGLGVSADASIGVSRGYFIVTDVRRLAKGKAEEDIEGWSIDGVMSAGKGVGVSVNASISIDKNGKPVFFKIGSSVGASFGSGLTVGGSHTLRVKPRN